jgi:hypothetical protein
MISRNLLAGLLIQLLLFLLDQSSISLELLQILQQRNSLLRKKENQIKTKQTNKTSKAQRVHHPKIPNFQNSTAKLWKELKLANCKELFG